MAGCTSSSSNDDEANVQQSCLDLGDAVIDAFVRCGVSRQEAYDAYYGQAGANCSHVVQIRDEGELRRACLPSLQSISCSDLDGLPSSCREQLLTQSTNAMQGGSLEPAAVSGRTGPLSTLVATP